MNQAANYWSSLPHHPNFPGLGAMASLPLGFATEFFVRLYLRRIVDTVVLGVFGVANRNCLTCRVGVRG